MRGFTHLRGPAFLMAGMCTALLMFSMFSGVASAQFSKDQGKCLNGANKNAAAIVKAQGKDICACIKDGAKGKLGTQTIEQCITADRKGKVKKAKDKYDDKTDDCDAGPVNLAPSDEVKQRSMDKDISLIHWIFGSDLDTAIILEATNKDNSKCQQQVAKAAKKCQDETLKAYNSCKKDALKGKNGPVITTALELQERCLGTGTESIPDPKSKIQKACQTKLLDAINKKCANNIDVFPGCPSPATAADLRLCIDYMIECEVCLWANGVDGLDRDCDLLDDGVENWSCEELGHLCQLDPTSGFVIETAIFPLAINLTGSLDITCGMEDPETGKAPCDCKFIDVDPVEIPAIGFVCLTAAGGCATGEVDCDGGNALNVDIIANHNLGDCPGGNADCLAQCTTFCGAATVFDSGCEGFCMGGANDGLACPTGEDTECPGGACTGQVSHGNICGCSCVSTPADPPADPGDVMCELGTSIVVETSAPCGDGDVLIGVGSQCIPITTVDASGIIMNANNIPAAELPVGGSTVSGSGTSCATLMSSVTTGINFVGNVSFYDTTIGDLFVKLDLICQ